MTNLEKLKELVESNRDLFLKVSDTEIELEVNAFHRIHGSTLKNEFTLKAYYQNDHICSIKIFDIYSNKNDPEIDFDWGGEALDFILYLYTNKIKLNNLYKENEK